MISDPHDENRAGRVMKSRHLKKNGLQPFVIDLSRGRTDTNSSLKSDDYFVFSLPLSGGEFALCVRLREFRFFLLGFAGEKNADNLCQVLLYNIMPTISLLCFLRSLMILSFRKQPITGGFIRSAPP